MVPKVKAWVSCLWHGHDYDKTGAFRNMPKDGAKCKRCGYTYEYDWKDYL